MMDLSEAMNIAFEGEHATATYDLAAAVIWQHGQGRDAMAYAKLADMKAEYQRLYDSLNRSGVW